MRTATKNTQIDLLCKFFIGFASGGSHRKLLRQIGFISYSDADSAGDRESSKSTTGIFMALTGQIFFPLNGVSKKQTCVSHSTPEAEIIAANAAVSLEGLPALQLWAIVLERKVLATLLEIT